jgi:hypothetical protein
MTNFVRKSLHSRTAVYFADGLHNPRKYALKFYADPHACAAERDAYRELQGKAVRIANAVAALFSPEGVMWFALARSDVVCLGTLYSCIAMHLAFMCTDLLRCCRWSEQVQPRA